jgi:uncharacterized membrane protein
MTPLWALLAGCFVGLRTVTPPAVTAWGAHVGRLRLSGPLAWIGTTPAVVIFTVLALAELVYDKLPTAGSRTEPSGVIARMMMGGLVGACVAAAGAQSAFLGALPGVVGALAGTFGGYQARTRLVKALRVPDFIIAVFEDLVAIGGSLWVISRF